MNILFIFSQFSAGASRRISEGQKQMFADVIQNMRSYFVFNIQRKPTVLESLFIIELRALGLQLKIKIETPTQVFSCDCCDIFTNSFNGGYFWKD